MPRGGSWNEEGEQLVNVVVCVKQIPGPETPPGFDEKTHNLVRAGGAMLDDSDNYSVEMALCLVEQAGEAR